MDSEETRNIPDLIVRKCPVDDCSHCAMIYINTLIGHRIICRCRCHSLTEETQERLNYRNSLQGPGRIGTPTSQAACASKPTTPVDATHVNVGLMESNYSTGRDHSSDTGGNLDINEE
jgi:hypothetical protein